MDHSREAIGTGCAPSIESFSEKQAMNMTGNGPRHKLNHLSLLPSGPDEVRDRLLRSGRSEWPAFSLNPLEGIQPRIKRISGIGHR